MKRDPAGYRSAVHHLAWLCVDDERENLHHADIPYSDDELILLDLDEIAAATNASRGPDDEHVVAYLRAAADLLNLADADSTKPLQGDAKDAARNVLRTVRGLLGYRRPGVERTIGNCWRQRGGTWVHEGGIELRPTWVGSRLKGHRAYQAFDAGGFRYSPLHPNAADGRAWIERLVRATSP